MGQTHKNKLTNQWTFVDNLGRFQIYRNQHNQLAEKHIVKADPKIQQSDYLTAYHQRYLPDKPIVNAYDAEFSDKKKGLCQNSSTITVFTEYIPHRLSDIQMLNHGQGMYVLSQALAGFSQLYNRVGPFQVHQDLIGFNQEGQVRVWHNPNFAQNSVDNDRIILMSTLNPYDFDRKFSQNQQHDMVEDTLNAISRYSQFAPVFLQQAQQLKKLNFNDARRVIANQINRKAYYVPDHLFLADKNNIIQKSGVLIRNKHIYNPNKVRKGQKYPYFMDQNKNPQGQTHYLQGQPTYGYDNNYYGDDTSSQTSGYANQGGFYNLNGQNYRIISQKQVDGNHINEQALIQEALRNQGYNNSQVGGYSPRQGGQTVQYSDPNFAQVRGGNRTDQYYPRYDRFNDDASSQYSQNQYIYPSRTNQLHPVYNSQYHNQQTSVQNQSNIQSPLHPNSSHIRGEGHIVIDDHQMQRQKQYNSRVIYSGGNNQLNTQPALQDSVRVFSVGQNGRVVQQSQQYQHDRSPHQQSVVHGYQQPVYQNSNLQNRYQDSNIYQSNYPQNPHSQQYLQQNNTHRHKIFQNQNRGPVMMREQQPHFVQQRVV